MSGTTVHMSSQSDSRGYGMCRYRAAVSSSIIDVQKLQQTGHRTGTISEVVVGAKIWGARSTTRSVWRRKWRAESVATVVPDVVW